jgi:hypothetical protein
MTQSRHDFLSSNIAVIAVIALGIFIHRREAQLIADAERAMPGPLKLR